MSSSACRWSPAGSTISTSPTSTRTAHHPGPAAFGGDAGEPGRLGLAELVGVQGQDLVFLAK
jgi:hypothetical protein